MDEASLRELLQAVQAGTMAPDDAVGQLRRLPFADLGYARVDHHRQVRQGAAEVVYAPGKTPSQCAAIVAELLSADASPVLMTRADAAQAEAALRANPGGERRGSTDVVVWRPAAKRHGVVAVVTAGTGDGPVADEAEAILAAHGIEVQRINDAGVAGLHRLLAELDTLSSADAAIVVAGMEGALPSVVGGLVQAPVVAVPTSVGYGAALEGVTALLAMLSSCAAGVTVVGIDNGFGAAMAIIRVLSGNDGG